MAEDLGGTLMVMAKDLGGALLSISVCLQYRRSKFGKQIKTLGKKKKKTINADIREQGKAQ